MRPNRRPWSLTVAALLVWLIALAVAGVGISSAVQLHGRFSAGVGVMLMAYAALLAWVGFAAWRCRFYSRGMLVGTGLLPLLLAGSSLQAGNVLVWLAVGAVSAVTVACAFAPATAKALRLTGPDEPGAPG